jgi:hypothetical protein
MRPDVFAGEDVLDYLPDDRDVHCHGVLPVPLAARLYWMMAGSLNHALMNTSRFVIGVQGCRWVVRECSLYVT